MFEVCVDSLHGALEAQRGGAGRIELCSNLDVGGLTPSYGLMKLVRKRIQVPVHVLIRPRAGDFVYSELEVEIMVADIGAVGELGLQGVAIGVLTETHEIDMKVMRVLLDECRRYNLSVTFHRAFDCVRAPLEAIKMVQYLGDVSRVLTSGQQPTAVEGLLLLGALMQEAGSNVLILPGAGITEENAAHIASELGAIELHGSVRKELAVCASTNLLPGDKNRVIWTVDVKKLHTIYHRCRTSLKVDDLCTRDPPEEDNC